MNTWNDLVVNIIVAVIGILFTYIGSKIAKDNKATTFIQATTQLAEAAVAYAEKLGVDEQLKGAAKKSAAVQSVISSLEKLGFKDVDFQTVENAVEAAFAKLKDTVESAYATEKGESAESTVSSVVTGEDGKESKVVMTSDGKTVATGDTVNSAASQVATSPENADVSK